MLVTKERKSNRCFKVVSRGIDNILNGIEFLKENKKENLYKLIKDCLQK